MYNHKQHFRTLVREAFPGVKIIRSGYSLQGGTVYDILSMALPIDGSTTGVAMTVLLDLPTDEIKLAGFSQSLFSEIQSSIAIFKLRK